LLKDGLMSLTQKFHFLYTIMEHIQPAEPSDDAMLGLTEPRALANGLCPGSRGKEAECEMGKYPSKNSGTLAVLG
jgi:hypothetical protein